MITMQVASVVGRVKQACHYGSLVIRDVTERVVLMVKVSDSQWLLEDCVGFFK